VRLTLLFVMHLRGLVLFTLFLLSAARRSMRMDDSHQDVLIKALQVSAEAREALLPDGFGKGLLRERGLFPAPWIYYGQPGPSKDGGTGALFGSHRARAGVPEMSEPAAVPEMSEPAAVPVRGDRASAERQLAIFYELAPWEAPAGRRNGPAWTIRPFDRGGVLIAPIFATQEGIDSPERWKNLRRKKKWLFVGDVCIEGEDPARVPVAIANQRPLIEASARASQTYFANDAPVFLSGPIQLAWATSMIPGPDGLPAGGKEVPPDLPPDESLKCGFRGQPSRTVASPGGGYKIVGTELPE